MSAEIRPEGPGGDRLRERAAERASVRRSRRVGLIAVQVVLFVFFAPAFLILLYAVVPPPVTPLMIIRAAEGHGLSKQWVPLERISPHLQRAVIAAEDAKFCAHGGFDWEAVDTAIERRRRGGRVLGASTISMQTAKNLFLWPDRTYFRKGGEVYITVWLETLLSKRRILELYLNVIELGPGIYGAEAASRHYFGVSAADLSPAQAARLASVLPSPLHWRPVPSARAGTIEVRARSVKIDSDGPC
jgi:monofunctional biosynthetic peptidoglycan transglycosylase